jgi:effector-binding domain-containing protein
MPNKLICLARAAVFAVGCGMAGAALADDASPQSPAPATSSPQAPVSAAPAAPQPAPSVPATQAPAAAAPSPGSASAPSTPPAAAPAAPSPAAPPAATPAAPAANVPAAPSTGVPAAPDQAKPGDQQTPHGDSTGQIVDLTARPFAYVEGKADKDEIFSAIMASLAAVKAEAEKAGLKIAGRPLAVFLQSDETGFRYRAGYPLETLPEGKTSLSDAVKLGQTPAGKAMRFQHAAAYSEIDATYDAITAYLDEKGIDAEDSFIEEYENDVKDIDDPNLQVNIYVLTK